jgi:hypothetical protein
MRQPAFFGAALAILALTADTVPTAAQSPYSYPWCLKGAKGGSMSCYYRNYDECRITVSGRGGWCMRSPYYKGPPAPWVY